MVERDPDVQGQIAQGITVTVGATDCPMPGHMSVDDGAETLTGGAGTLEDRRLAISGPADTLVGLMRAAFDAALESVHERETFGEPIGKTNWSRRRATRSSASCRPHGTSPGAPSSY